jgi:hypothetical protein
MPTDPPTPGTTRGVRVELLSHDGCPLVEKTRVLLRDCLTELRLTTSVIERVGDYPSPTVLINGKDVSATPSPARGSAACRLETPTHDQVRRALLDSVRTSRQP